MVANFFEKKTIEHSYQEILSVVRSSPLHFAIQETPFSFYFTVRKSLNKSSDSDLSFHQQTVPTSRVEHEQDSFQSKIKVFEVREGVKIILRGGLLKSRTSPFENTYPP